MAIAKMKYLNVVGPEKLMLHTLSILARCESFAPEGDEAIHSSLHGVNVYEPLFTKAKGLLTDLGQSSLAADFIGSENTYNLQEASDYVEQFAAEVAERNRRKTELENALEIQEKTEGLLSHMTDLDINIDELFTVEYLKVRVGRLPKNSYARLAYYAEKGFNFTSYFNFIVYDFDGDYYWGLYFAPQDSAKEIDDIFNSLYFERIWVPEFVHGKPEEALDAIRDKENELRHELETLVTPTGLVTEEELWKIANIAAWLGYMSQLFEMQKYALVFNHMFYISGFVPADEYTQFQTLIEETPSVQIKEADNEASVPAKPPVKLKNGWFSKPFEMFTEMYGLPTYGDVDPTGLVGWIYSILYGLMFADLGQGVVLGLIGYFFMYKYKHMAIGRILARVSLFCCLFGFLFGSVFGYEHLLHPLFEWAGLRGLPFEVMSGDNIVMILLISLVIGAVILVIAILLSIYTNIREHNLGVAITSPNGVAGLLFYLAVLTLALDVMVLHSGFTSQLFFILPFVVLPLAVMYLQEPLTELINGHGFHIHKPSEVFVNGFFELFVSLLEYLSNTVSFLRVGGFVLAHAGMMSVVMTLADITGSAGPVVVVIGNIVVIALEGLIVGIQALRLNYYEVFSRFYNPNGQPFKPLQFESDTVEL